MCVMLSGDSTRMTLRLMVNVSLMLGYFASRVHYDCSPRHPVRRRSQDDLQYCSNIYVTQSSEEQAFSVVKYLVIIYPVRMSILLAL